MDTNTQARPPQGGEPPMEAGDDWRSQLQSDSRHRIVAKIIERLKRRIPFEGKEGLNELERAAVMLEEKIYVGASNESDYLRKISLKMLTIETKSQTTIFLVGLDAVLMDGNNQRPPEGGEPSMEAGYWRSQLQLDSRCRIIAKMTDTLKRHLPFSGLEGSRELEMIAVRFERKIYAIASSQSDYVRKISLKMLTMGTKSQTTIFRTALDAVLMDGNNQRPPEGGEPSMEAGCWRSQLQLDSRRRIITKMTDTLKRHLPFSGLEGSRELEMIAVRFEQKIYAIASSQSDYLRKISLKMLAVEAKDQTAASATPP
ncbi:hypothetical protein C1H46_036224 [Malus baccata]|uniref:Mediator complex subunit 15 KIX domain-containing protein n=1 Tax=Malus baccata TaxID=106549 RepID=A0A540KVG5_MALBA|nr:hypothetical protein C1H46_036224 [Malus baccata]